MQKLAKVDTTVANALTFTEYYENHLRKAETHVSGPASEEEVRYISTMCAFIVALVAGHDRRAKVLARDLMLHANNIGSKREVELLRWLIFER
jgi:hypothetical protein